MTLPIASIAGHVIAVTGANRGLGYATALELAQRGAVVIAGMRTIPPHWDHASILPYSLDMTDANSRQQFIQKIVDQHGRLDGLIQNAGVNPDKNQTACAIDLEVVREVFEVNFFGVFALGQLALAQMARQRYGRIVHVSSGYGSMVEMGALHPGYRLSKLALNGLTRIFDAEIDTQHIKVNSISPGWVRTDMGGASAPRAPQDAAREIADLASLDRSGPSGSVFLYGEPTEW